MQCGIDSDTCLDDICNAELVQTPVWTYFSLRNWLRHLSGRISHCGIGSDTCLDVFLIAELAQTLVWTYSAMHNWFRHLFERGLQCKLYIITIFSIIMEIICLQVYFYKVLIRFFIIKVIFCSAVPATF